MVISIIVPLYYGKKYIRAIIEQIEANAENISCKVELLLVNDAPDDPINESWISNTIQIRIMNTDINRGIHGARVRGLENASGQYVLFLDQDDKIAPMYLKSQLACIGGTDAVVCRVIHNHRLHYTNTHVFEKVVSKEFMLKKWCPIVSPGQVLIKKEGIPKLWRERIMKHKGADDYFLWLLMCGEGKTFSLNQEVLFEHVIKGNNASGDTNEMMDSELEMIRILDESHVFHDEEAMWLSSLPESLRRIHIKELDTYKRIVTFWQCWTREAKEKDSLPGFFVRNHINKIAIYGAGDFGRSISLLLEHTGVEVCFYIDQNAQYIISDIPVYQKEEMDIGIDAIIMTIKDKTVKEAVIALANCPVYDAEEIWE